MIDDYLRVAKESICSSEPGDYIWGCLHALIYIAEDINAIREILEKEHEQIRLNDLAEKVPDMQQIDKSVGSPAPLGNIKEQEQDMP